MAKSFKDITTKINTKDSFETMFQLGDSDLTSSVRIPTGVLSVDLSMGGGFPTGTINQLYGAPGCGKSSLAAHTVGLAQRNGMNCVYLDVENAFDKELARMSGIDVDDLIVAQPATAEDTLNILREYLDADDLHLLVVDSVAGMVPERMLQGDFSDQHVGLQARILSQAFLMIEGLQKRKKKATPDAVPLTMIWINQQRYKVGGASFGPQKTTPGGEALKYWSKIMMEVRQIERLKGAPGEDPPGHRVQTFTSKNKASAPFRKAEFDLYYDSGVSNASSILDLGVAFKVIKQSGAWYGVAETGLKLGQGRMASIQTLNESPDVVQELTEQITKAYTTKGSK